MKLIYGILAVLFFVICAPIRVVNAQSAVNFIPGDYLYNADSDWNNPIRALGMPDARSATISAVGLPTYQALFEVPETFNYATISAVKIDVIGKSASNLVLFIDEDYSSLCNGQQLSFNETEPTHHYYTFNQSSCPGLDIQSWYEHAFGFHFSYYYGAQNVSAEIDSVMAYPIFAGGGWDTTIQNNVQLYSTPGMPQYEETQYTEIEDLMKAKVPWAYIYALTTLNMGADASNSAIPAVNINYVSKYKGDEVFSYNFLVEETDLPDLSDIRNTLRTTISIILWIGVIWYFAKHWRVLF